MRTFGRLLSNQWLLATVGAVLAVTLGWLALQEVEWPQVWRFLVEFPIWLFVLALLLTILSAFVRAVRWRVLFTDRRVRTYRLFLLENACIGLNNASPVRVLAEPSLVGLLVVRDGLHPGEVMATVVTTRAIDLVVTLTILIIGFILLPVLQPFAPLVVIATLTSATGIVGFFAAALGARRLPLLRRLPFAHHLAEAVHHLRQRPRRVILAVNITVVQWLLLGMAAWMISLGTPEPVLPHVAMVAMLGAQYFATSVPGLPAALGTFEFAVVFLLEFMGLSKESAVTFAFLTHVLLFVPPTFFALLVLPREGVRSLGSLRELGQRFAQTE